MSVECIVSPNLPTHITDIKTIILKLNVDVAVPSGIFPCLVDFIYPDLVCPHLLKEGFKLRVVSHLCCDEFIVLVVVRHCQPNLPSRNPHSGFGDELPEFVDLTFPVCNGVSVVVELVEFLRVVSELVPVLFGFRELFLTQGYRVVNLFQCSVPILVDVHTFRHHSVWPHTSIVLLLNTNQVSLSLLHFKVGVCLDEWWFPFQVVPGREYTGLSLLVDLVANVIGYHSDSTFKLENSNPF